ncbi:MAG: PqqD family protein [Oscillospiraceae bacterium]|nr:PqqD family protein [Oscillospiraceae bacterium]
MKIKNGFMLRKVGTQNVVVAVGEASRSFNGLIRLNDSGCFLWEKLQSDTTEQQLLTEMLAEYDTDEATAKADIARFISALKGADLLE